MSHYKPYPAYRDSGVEWIGQVPEHWVECSLKHALAEMGSGGTPDTDNPDYWCNKINGTPWIAISDMSSTEFVDDCQKAVTQAGIESKRLKVFPQGTLLFSMYASLGHVAELGMAATTNQAILALLPASGINQRFLKRWLQSLQPYLVVDANNATQDNLNAEKVRNLPFVKAPLIEQQRIATQVDSEVVRIDALITKKTRFIELLKEKRHALIDHAVTKGLNSEAPIRNSEVEWLGEIPAHWEVRRMASIFREAIRPGDQSLPILSISIHDGITDEEVAAEDRDRRVSQIEDRTKYKRVAPNDLAYNMMRAWQGAFGAVTVDGLVSPAYVVAEPMIEFRTAYIENLLRTPMAIEEMRRYSRGIADFRMRLYWDYFRDLKVCLPPLEEQDKILDLITRETSRIDRLTKKTQRSIDLLKERRAAFITAAVTGQIDLRESA